MSLKFCSRAQLTCDAFSLVKPAKSLGSLVVVRALRRVRKEKVIGKSSPRIRGHLLSLMVILLFLPLTVQQPRRIADSWKLFSVLVEHSQQDTLNRSDRNLLPERRLKLRSSSDSLPRLEMMSPRQVTKLRWNVIWPQPGSRGPRAHGPLQLKSRRSLCGFLVICPVSNSSLRTLKRPKLLWRHGWLPFSWKRGDCLNCGRSSHQRLRLWTLMQQNSLRWNIRCCNSSGHWRSNVVLSCSPRNRKQLRTFAKCRRKSV